MVINNVTNFAAIDRRSFVLGAGSLFLSSLSAGAQEKIISSEALFASCVKKPNGSFGAVLLDQNYSVIRDIDLPMRGHDVVLSKDANLAVIFSRRPGNLATIIHTKNDAEPLIISAPNGRHFYGHGVFSANDKLLYASENDFENGIGKIGIYDATNRFTRIGEFDSFGVGPHEVILLKDGKTLAVANGGIETHPDFGRAKLNLASMKSSVVFMNAQDGRMFERHLLPKYLQKLSIRHMVCNDEKSIVFGGQYQDQSKNIRPLMGSCTLGGRLRFWKTEPKLLERFSNYTGSIAISKDKQHIAISSPKSGIVGVFESDTGVLLNQYNINKASGIGAIQNEFMVSTLNGDLVDVGAEKQKRDFDFLFDNHLAIL